MPGSALALQGVADGDRRGQGELVLLTVQRTACVDSLTITASAGRWIRSAWPWMPMPPKTPALRVEHPPLVVIVRRGRRDTVVRECPAERDDEVRSGHADACHPGRMAAPAGRRSRRPGGACRPNLPRSRSVTHRPPSASGAPPRSTVIAASCSAPSGTQMWREYRFAKVSPPARSSTQPRTSVRIDR